MRFPEDKIRILNLVVLILIVALIFSNCAGSIKYKLLASENLNITCNDDTSLSLVIRLYFLTDNETFESALFEQLWDDSKSALGGSLVGEIVELTVLPGQTLLKQKLDRPKGALYLGAVAGYREPVDNGWRSVIPLNKGGLINITLYEQKMVIE